jgi:hypothetical protein
MLIDWGLPIFYVADEGNISNLYQVCWISFSVDAKPTTVKPG